MAIMMLILQNDDDDDDDYEYDFIAGKFIGSSHSVCNLKCKLYSRGILTGHNISRFDQASAHYDLICSSRVGSGRLNFSFSSSLFSTVSNNKHFSSLGLIQSGIRSPRVSGRRHY